MKTKLLFLTVAIFLAGGVFAQRFTIGIKGGANLGKIDGQSFKNEFKMGYQIGGFVTIPFGKVIGLQPEVIFNQTNVDTSNNFSAVYNNFNKINNIQLKELLIPIMLNVNLNKYFTLQAGPQFGVAISQNKNILQNGEDAFKGGNFALAGGLQVNLSKFRVYGRYVGGVTNIDNVGNKDSWKAQNIQLGLGLAL